MRFYTNPHPFYCGINCAPDARIDDRCTPAWAVEVSRLAAMLGFFGRAQDRGVDLDTKAVRLIAYRYADRARLKQQIENTAFEDPVAGRRAVVNSASGRVRLR